MIIEVNTDLLNSEDKINMNQLVFLSMVLDKNQKYNQDVCKVISLITDDDISYLISHGLITSIERSNSITYNATDKLRELVRLKSNYFDLFYEMYPVYVLRPDGSKSYLRANINKCRKMFHNITGNSTAAAEHIIRCLEFEIDKKTKTGKLSYMKTMWRWLVDHQWEETEEEMRDTEPTSKIQDYGTELI